MSWLHRLTDVDGEARTAICSHCGPVKIVKRTAKAGNAWTCAERQRAYGKKWRAENAEKSRAGKQKWVRENPQAKLRAQRRWMLKQEYGITLETYEWMWREQDGLCAICGQPERDNKSLSVDHNHKTDEIRGLLCDRCNTGLGKFDDDPSRFRAAAEYLERPCSIVRRTGT
jgi:Autographiviridae endonuclease VII